MVVVRPPWYQGSNLGWMQAMPEPYPLYVLFLQSRILILKDMTLLVRHLVFSVWEKSLGSLTLYSTLSACYLGLFETWDREPIL